MEISYDPSEDILFIRFNEAPLAGQHRNARTQMILL